MPLNECKNSENYFNVQQMIADKRRNFIKRATLDVGILTENKNKFLLTKKED